MYSRQYLQGLPEAHRRQTIQNDVFRLFQQMEQRVRAGALRGETRYLHDMLPWTQEREASQRQREKYDKQEELRQKQGYPPGPFREPVIEASSDELLAGLREKFPDCTVSFQEDWVETRQGVRELKKGILIDWS
jgi:hypothetical protein